MRRVARNIAFMLAGEAGVKLLGLVWTILALSLSDVRGVAAFPGPP